MLKKIALVLVLLVVVLLIVVAFQPADYKVERTARMSAPPAKIFEQVNDFHRWDAWSPWAKIDPAVKETFDGAPAGKGAIYTWAGNSTVGKGRMEITDTKPAEDVRINLDFVEPFAANDLTEFIFKPDGDATLVTWTMTGKNNFVGKFFCLFMNMDKMVGGDFEKGLASMKAIVEAPPKS